MKSLAVISLSSLIGLAFAPAFDEARVDVPIGGTESAILSSSSDAYEVHFLGDAFDGVDDYAPLVEAAVSSRFQNPQPAPGQNPAPVPAPPRSTLPSQSGQPICSSGNGGGQANDRCSTDANQTKCSASGNEANGAGHNCSSGDFGGNGECSANSGGWGTRCSVHGGLDNHCSAAELGANGAGVAKCSAIEKGFCSVFAGGGDPGANGGGGQGGKDNSCSAFGQAGENPKCSAFAQLGFPLCSVLKNKANATCTVVDSETIGKGAGTCSTMKLDGTKIGPPPNFCSVVSFVNGEPHVDPPGANDRCTTTKPVGGGGITPTPTGN